MEISIRRRSRALWLLAAGGGAAIALTAIGLSLGSSSAHASERPTGLIDELTSIVDSTTSSVATATGQLVNGLVDEVVVPLVETVTPVIPTATAPVADVVTQIVDPTLNVVASAPVVGPEVATLVGETVNIAVSTVGTAVNSGTEFLGSNPVHTITDPLLSTIGNVPIVGDLVGSLDPLLSSGVSGVDSTLGTVGNLVRDAADPVTEIAVTTPGVKPESETPWIPGQTPIPAVPEFPVAAAEPPPSGESSNAPNARFSGDTSRGSPVATALGIATINLGDAASPDADTVQGIPVPGSDFGGTSMPSSAPAPSSSAGSGGGSTGSLATLTSSDPQPSSAGAAAFGADNDELPAAPVFDTDISPD